MRNFKLSPQTITLWIAGISFIPRFLSPAAYQTGTVAILLFWVAMCVLLPELVKDYETNKRPILKLPTITISILSLSCFILVLTFFWRNIIYEDQTSNAFIQNLKRSLYLIHPLICLSWYPLVNNTKRTEFIKTLSLLTFGYAIALIIPVISDKTFVGVLLNEITASNAAKILSIIKGSPISVNGITFSDQSFAIQVGLGCSASPEIGISLLAIFVFAICCRIKSTFRISIVVILSILLVFLLNIVRIAILGHLVSVEKIKGFDFWHDGLGSLIFSFIVMTLTSFIYYFFWCKENPLSDSEAQTANDKN